MKLLMVFLYPFAVLYNLVTAIRNRLYDLGIKPSAQFEVPLIGVGNLTVGGTGKTPMVEHLVRLLKPTHKVSILSRGYKRKTKGFRLAKSDDTSLTLGDEPYQFYKKFTDTVIVAVGEERAIAIPQILDEHPDTDVILLDDAYQHRSVQPSFQILLTDYRIPFYKDLLLPAGTLREARKNACRADVIVVTKCPSGIAEDEMIDIEAHIRKYANKPVFFTSIRYGELISINDRALKNIDKVILVTGIANTNALKVYVNANYKLIKHFNFSDHHQYTNHDLKMICDFANTYQAVILTTEKDAARIDSENFRTFLSGTSFLYLPIEIEFLKNGKDFDEMALNAAKNV